jgi:hypothetical protein
MRVHISQRRISVTDVVVLQSLEKGRVYFWKYVRVGIRNE